MKKVIIAALLVFFMVFTVSAAHAGMWFTGTIDKIVVKQDGVVEITLDQSGTPRWARVDVTKEWKAFLAAALTAQAGTQTVRMNYQGGNWVMIELQ